MTSEATPSTPASDDGSRPRPVELTVAEVSARMRARAEHVLGERGLSLELTGHMWAADLVCVSSRTRDSITGAERDALEKAASALGYSPVQVATLFLPEVRDAAGQATQTDEVLTSLIGVLNPMAVIYLDAAAYGSGAATDRLTVPVTDFFGSLGDEGRKRIAWAEMQPAKVKPIFK